MTEFTIEDRLFTAMCIWEALLETRKHPGFEYSKEQVGWAQTRSDAADFSEPCHRAYEYAHKHLGYDDSYDWDWVPRFVTMCVNDEFQLKFIGSKTLAELVMEN